jgi:hypothetical protein
MLAADFETGALPSTCGLVVYDPLRDDAKVIDAAAHRGGLGLRAIATGLDAGAPGQELAKMVCTVPPSTELFTRYWFRVTAGGDQPPSRQFTFGYSAAVTGALGSEGLGGHMLELDPSGGTFTVQEEGFSLPGNYTGALSTGHVHGDGTWHLFEERIYGVGGMNGGTASWIDGQLIGTRYGLDWTGIWIGAVDFGALWQESWAPFWGTLDFDDVRVSTGPPASQLRLSAGTHETGSTQGCTGVRVELLDSLSSSLAAAPYDVPVQLAWVSDGGTEAASPCPGSVGAATILAGTAGIDFAVGLPSGSTGLVATSPDFLDSNVVTVDSKGGTADASSPPPFTADSGCSAVGGGGLFAAAFVVLMRARRARRS